MAKKIPNNTGKTYKTNKPNYKAGMFATFYMNPQSETFMNARASAMRAGYSEEYSSNITHLRPKWFVELSESSQHERAAMLAGAQRNLKKVIDKPQSSLDKDGQKLQVDVSKFVSERIGKDHYSTRQELTDKGGRKLFTNETKETADVALEDMFTTIAPQE